MVVHGVGPWRCVVGHCPVPRKKVPGTVSSGKSTRVASAAAHLEVVTRPLIGSST